MIEAIVRAENRFPQTFADMEERDWGVLFVTPTIPDSHDGNHACVLNRHDDLAAVVDEIVAFYEGRALTPRVNYISADGDYSDLRKALGAAGFTVGHEGAMQIYLYHGPSRIAPAPNVRVQRVESVDPDMLAALTSIGNLRMAKVLQRRASRADDWLFVGEVDGQVASVALLERVGNICRVDEVNTAECHRRKGCARAVVHAMVTYYRKHISIPLYLWTDSPVAERIYIEAGFVKLEQSLTNWTAWRDTPDTHGGEIEGSPATSVAAPDPERTGDPAGFAFSVQSMARRTLNMTNADKVWNRAALAAGGDSPGPGDHALASLLLVHGLVMNGGVHHAIECIEPAELLAAAEGYSFFGFDDVAAFLRGAADDPVLSTWTDDTEVAADRRYAEMVPDDSHLVARFEDVFHEHGEQFAPLDLA